MSVQPTLTDKILVGLRAQVQPVLLEVAAAVAAMVSEEHFASRYPIVELPGSSGWTDAYDWGEALDKAFPGQDGSDFSYACRYNDPGPAGHESITRFVMVEQGEHDGADWHWRVTFADGSTWNAVGGCDYTGWDCQSRLEWSPS